MSRVRMLVAIAVCAVATLSAGAAAAEAYPETRAHAPAPKEGVVSALAIRPAVGRAEVVITLDGATRVRDFRLTARERIVLDISGAKLRLPARRYDRVQRGGIVDVRWSQWSPGIVRVVLTLDRRRDYTVARSDSTVTIAVVADSGVSFAAWQAGDKRAATAVAAKSAAPDTKAPGDADQKEAAEDDTAGEAKPEIEIPVAARAGVSSQAAVASRTEPEAAPQGATRQAEARADEPADAPLTDVTTEEAIASTQRERPVLQQRMQQPRISVAWSNADIREVLAQFAAFSGRTIIVGRGVEATITAEILDQPWDVAMAAVLASQGLAATEDASGIIVVDTYQNIASRRTSEPLATRTVRLNYARASSVAENLRQRLTRDCSRSRGTVSPNAGSQPGQPQPAFTMTIDPTCPVRGAVTADTLTNSISITDVPGALTELSNYAHSLDIRQPQVAVKAKIVLVDRTSLEALGLRYDIGTRENFFNRLMPRLDSLGAPIEGAGRFVLGGNSLAGIANASAQVPNSALSLVYSAAIGRFDFTTFLDAMQETSLLDVQSEPSVVTLNNRTAVLRAGVEVPIRVIEANTAGGGGGAAFPRATVQLRQTGIILNVTPQITANRQIIMRVVAENSDVDYRSGDVGAVFPTQRVENELLVADGETAVMGGLTQTRVSVTKTGIPILVDLPLIGRLFGVTNRAETKRDLLILITPHIVDEGQTVPEVPDAR
ncbi:MAG TPA: AMIN domain-containing protein [Gemmatimonadaceae bacterium]|nr:AMIN domain-containing protein [Gemmatimonadaceae bacterium]